MTKLIQKIGFFRLLLVPTGIAIIITAIINNIIGMGIVGGIVLIFGFMNKCLLLGSCELPANEVVQRQKHQNRNNDKIH